eukprot:6192932-Pleurochrysis_carterae.AAC.1
MSAAPDSVMVAVRCRPFNTREKNQNEGKIVTITSEGEGAAVSLDQVRVRCYRALHRTKLIPPFVVCPMRLQPDENLPPRKFYFDHTYDDDVLQSQVLPEAFGSQAWHLPMCSTKASIDSSGRE